MPMHVRLPAAQLDVGGQGEAVQLHIRPIPRDLELDVTEHVVTERADLDREQLRAVVIERLLPL